MDRATKIFLTEPEHNRKLIRLGLITLMLMSAVSAGILILALILGLKEPQNRYFIVTPQGQIIEVLGQETPGMSDVKRAAWTVNQVMEAMTFSFSNWRREMPRAEEGFDAFAWQDFISSLREQGWWNRIENERMNLTTLPVSVPVMTQEQQIDGIRVWEYEIELLHEFEGANGVRRSQRTHARITVEERELAIAPAGLIITNLVLFGVAQ